jgi:hypothetical protein
MKVAVTHLYTPFESHGIGEWCVERISLASPPVTVLLVAARRGKFKIVC